MLAKIRELSTPRRKLTVRRADNGYVSRLHSPRRERVVFWPQRIVPEVREVERAQARTLVSLNEKSYRASHSAYRIA